MSTSDHLRIENGDRRHFRIDFTDGTRVEMTHVDYHAAGAAAKEQKQGNNAIKTIYEYGMGEVYAAPKA